MDKDRHHCYLSISWLSPRETDMLFVFLKFCNLRRHEDGKNRLLQLSQQEDMGILNQFMKLLQRDSKRVFGRTGRIGANFEGKCN